MNGTEDKNRQAGSASHESERLKQMLREALPPITDDQQLQRDLWPSILRRIDEPDSRRLASIPWFDWALAGGLLVMVSMVPRSIPVILYYL